MYLKQASSLLGILIACLSISLSSADTSLGKFIKHFEPLNYDTKAVHSSHQKAILEGNHYDIQFDAFGLRHKLRIKQDHELFTPDATIQDGDGKPIKIDHSSFITGEIVGEPGSKVHGVMNGGAFRGKIIRREGNFYVEPAKNYIDDPEFHSVIYKEGDVKYEANYADISKRLPKHEEQLDQPSNERSRRATNEEQMKNNVCKLKLIGDQTFSARFGGNAEAATKIVEHVAAVKTIFMDDFNQTKYNLYSPYGITFRVQQIIVYDSSTVPDKYKKDNLGIDPMLDLLSQDNHDDVCEAFLFTDRDFEGGILGLAWIGSPSKLGGICSIHVHREGSGKSYNTGIVTTKLYGRFTPPRISEVTFAHELGHGFGSQHDPDGAPCSPGGQDGNYIMYSKATSGDRTNNDKFSECSLKSIRDNVNEKRTSSNYKDCFSSGDEAICGNMLIEKDEQCDCGDKLSCLEEGDCCYPPGTPKQCRLKQGDCSLSQGPCCTNKCKYAPNKVCRNSTTCIKEAKCPSSSISCPTVIVTDPKTTCNEGRSVCGADGSCSTSICSKYKLEECQCSTEGELCDICCKNPGKDQKCIAAKHYKELPKDLYTVKKIPGSPCSNMHGYCDVFAVCRMVDQSGPLKRLAERWLTVKGLKSTAQEYWWAILIGVLVGIALIALMVFVCVRYTPSSNPIREQKRPAKKLPKRKKKNQDRIQDAGRHSPTMEMEHQV